MKNSRPRIKYAQIPHSISRCIENITNPTASALLSYLTRTTIGFGYGGVELSYRKIAKALRVTTRTITKAAKILERLGVILRERVSAGDIFIWRVVLERDEILEDPNKIYTVRDSSKYGDRDGDKIDRSARIRSIDHQGYDHSITTSSSQGEHPKPHRIKAQSASIEQKNDSLKKDLKKTDLKKQHHCMRLDGSRSQAPTEQTTHLAARRAGDEPLHKILLKTLREYGVRQRVARKLCREYDHTLIQSVLDTVPQLTGIENLPGYLVSAIQDGGYQTAPSNNSKNKKSPGQPSAKTQKNGRQVSGGRSNYAHLTDHNVNRPRHNSVKNDTEAPINYRTVEETQAEAQALEQERLAKEQDYQSKGKTLAARFSELSTDVKTALKNRASQRLSQLVGNSAKKDQILQDKSFQRVTNRTVLENFFGWLDQGMPPEKALSLA